MNYRTGVTEPQRDRETICVMMTANNTFPLGKGDRFAVDEVSLKLTYLESKSENMAKAMSVANAYHFRFYY